MTQFVRTIDDDCEAAIRSLLECFTVPEMLKALAKILALECFTVPEILKDCEEISEANNVEQ
jgi:hypothetical protein